MNALPLPEPEVILTHESDLDGFTAGLLAQRLAEHLFGRCPRLEAWNSNAWKLRPLQERSAWVTDFSFEARLDKPNWVVIDHHVSEANPRQARLIHDPKKSAGALVYDLCRAHQITSPELDRIVHWNNLADLYLSAEPEFTAALDYASLVKTYGFWNLHALIGGKLEQLLDHPLLEVVRIKRTVEDPLGYTYSRTHVEEITPEVGWVDTVVGNPNAIVHRLLAEAATPYRVLITLTRRAPAQVVVSLRSRQGEALEVARKLGGGGHPNAAGATLPRSVRQVADGADYLRGVLRPRPTTGLNPLDDLLKALEP